MWSCATDVNRILGWVIFSTWENVIGEKVWGDKSFENGKMFTIEKKNIEEWSQDLLSVKISQKVVLQDFIDDQSSHP